MRHEFGIVVKREALARSGGVCEAQGGRYGLPPSERCTTPIGPGKVQFDHWPRGAHDPSPGTRSLDNCVACCPAHNQYAANHTDKTVEAKLKRVQRKHGPVEYRRKPKGIPNRGFQKNLRKKMNGEVTSR